MSKSVIRSAKPLDGDCKLCKYAEISLFGKMPKCKAYLTHSPMSWCYVEV